MVVRSSVRRLRLDLFLVVCGEQAFHDPESGVQRRRARGPGRRALADVCACLMRIIE